MKNYVLNIYSRRFNNFLNCVKIQMDGSNKILNKKKKKTIYTLKLVVLITIISKSNNDGKSDGCLISVGIIEK